MEIKEDDWLLVLPKEEVGDRKDEVKKPVQAVKKEEEQEME